MGKSIIVSSGKGGVGKTNVTINLGVALSELGKSVAIVDGSLTTPDISLHLKIPFHIRSLSHVLKEDSNIEAATFNHKSGVRIIPGNIHTDILKEFQGKKFLILLKNLKKEHDFVLVDCAAGLGKEAVSAIKNCDEMLVVANPELPSVVNASKAIQVAKENKVKPMGVILNRVGRNKQELKEKDISPLLYSVPIIGKIPEDKKVDLAIKKSEAIVSYAPKSRVSREFKKIAFSLSGGRVNVIKKKKNIRGIRESRIKRKKKVLKRVKIRKRSKIRKGKIKTRKRQYKRKKKGFFRRLFSFK